MNVPTAEPTPSLFQLMAAWEDNKRLKREMIALDNRHREEVKRLRLVNRMLRSQIAQMNRERYSHATV